MTERLNSFVTDALHLKRVDRAGWVRNHIENPESVAEHSFGTALLALVLAPRFGVDTSKAVQMALVHDLAEYIVPDYTPSDNIPPEEKFRQEREAMELLCAKLANGEELLRIWHECKAGKTKEARFVKQIDRLEMMFQAKIYGDEKPDVSLEEFWIYIKDFNFGDLTDIFKNIKE